MRKVEKQAFAALSRLTAGSAFHASKPASILVLPADNGSPDVSATHRLTSRLRCPLSLGQLQLAVT
ncbi:GNA1162 family protein [Pantoea anthophila]|uniref:GNA1162 family protein n=1 Tax=Pantoea anthophila TaxID=470931 RepID=UPI003CEF27F4